MAKDETPGRAAYKRLTQVFEQALALGGVQKRLFRDMQTTMPEGASADHDLETRVLTEIAHEKIADPRVAEWLKAAEAGAAALDDGERANLRAMRRWHRLEAGLPQELAGALAQAANEGERLHGEVKHSGDWARALPMLERQIALKRAEGAALCAQTGAASAYDALLDKYSEGWTSADYDKLFDALEPYLKTLLPAAMAAQGAPAPIAGPFAADKQAELCRDVADRMGFDFTRGVMYFIPNHPCADGTRNDTRVAGRPDPDGFLRPVYDMIHELGHGLYGQNTPAAWEFQPAGEALGMDVHESQSLIWEFVVGKSAEFNRFLAGRAQELFGRKDDPALSAENLLAANRFVTPNLVRIDAETSEATYLLHIIMRYRLEKRLIEGALEAKDLPKAWDKMTEDMFGRKPKNHAEGCLQDVHWFCGLWGYFPSYALGYMGAVQLYGAAVKAHPDIPAGIEKGDFSKLSGWLEENVHGRGSLVTAKELIRAATGADLSAEPLKEHLNARYLPPAAAQPAARKATRFAP